MRHKKARVTIGGIGIDFITSARRFARGMARVGAALVRLAMARMAIEHQPRGPRIGRKNMPGPPLRRNHETNQ